MYVYNGIYNGIYACGTGDYATYVATVEEYKIGLARQKKAQDLKKEKLQEFVSREGKKFDNNNHQMQRKSKLKKLNAIKNEEIEEFEEDAEVGDVSGQVADGAIQSSWPSKYIYVLTCCCV